jgi:hypothetical protein
MTGNEPPCSERSSPQASEQDVGSQRDARACAHRELQAHCQSLAGTDTAEDGLPETAFAPASQRRLLRHLLALQAGDAGLPPSHLDDRAPAPHIWQAER